MDTSVWSLALRRPKGAGNPPQAARLLRSLIQDGEPVALPGVVLQELLSGLRHRAQFNRLRAALDPFPVILATTEDHVRAAEVVNSCRRKGVQAGTVDALIVAITLRMSGVLLATDRDYDAIKSHVPFGLQLLPADK